MLALLCDFRDMIQVKHLLGLTTKKNPASLQSLIALLEVPHDVDCADVGPEDHAAEPEEEDEAVLPQPPPAPAEVVPVACRVDDGRGHEGQS